MKKILLLAICLTAFFFGYSQKLNVDFPYIKTIDYESDSPVDFARYGLCQIRFDLIDTENGSKIIKDQEAAKTSLNKCIEKAIKEKINVVVFPELSLAFDENVREEMISQLMKISKQHDMIFFAGSFYNQNRQNTVPIILPTGICYGYKIKQSMFEVFPMADTGMVRGDTMTIILSKYGKILPIVCVDQISDEVQFVVRYLSNKNRINTLINISYNPAGHEFMREMSALVKRHNLFGMIANIANPDEHSIATHEDNSYGNTSVFANLDLQKSYAIKHISNCFKSDNKDRLHPAYSMLISQIDPDREAILMVDLNTSITRPVKTTNAPDQGYPTIKGIKIVDIK